MATAEERLGMSAAGTTEGREADEAPPLGMTLLEGSAALGTGRLGDGSVVGRSLRIDVSDDRTVGMLEVLGIVGLEGRGGTGATGGATAGVEIMGSGTTGGVGTNPLSGTPGREGTFGTPGMGSAGTTGNAGAGNVGAPGNVGTPGSAGTAATGFAFAKAAREHAMNDIREV